ncbi:family 38 glycoside hydrolase [Melampsora americana]|nr:family 38 glycoside hydrolase [Melampsora americana]
MSTPNYASTDLRGGSVTPNYPLREPFSRANRFRDITLSHLDNFEGGDYDEYNITSVLFEGRDGSESAVQLEVWSAPGTTKPTFAEAVKQKYTKMGVGFEFGPSWTNHWIRATLNVKSGWRDKERVQFEFDPGCEAMIFSTEGLPLQGITGGHEGQRRVEFIIPKADRHLPLRLYIEVTANGLFGVPDEGKPIHIKKYYKLESADIVVPRQEAWHLMWDMRVIRDIAKNLPVTNPACLKAQSVAMEISKTFRADDLSTIPKCRKIAEKVLGKDWSSQSPYHQDHDWNPDGERDGVSVLGIGNCHIDVRVKFTIIFTMWSNSYTSLSQTAWLWPFSATQQKIARSWSTQIDLIQRYPEYNFVASQAQQFKWLEELYPQLFSKVRREVENGRFHIIGGSWVEHDTNLPSGESLCRQFSYGQRFFKSRFGKICDVLWLPDSFGYGSQIPQICRLAGISSFFTQKLSWSQFNKFTHTTFNWIGIDGTQVLVHMTPVDTYNAQGTVADVIKATSNHKDLEWSDKSLIAFGNGDGGGGPLAPMLESLRRIRAAANHTPASGIPKVTLGKSVPEFFKTIVHNTRGGKDLPTWRGELYLEYHRGTYTSHGSIKRHNRKSEVMLREIEYLATLASISPDRDGYEYPKDTLDSMWETVLLCQFHDVLPGSAINMVYVDAEKMYAEVAKKGAALLEEAHQVLHPKSYPLESLPNGPNKIGTSIAINTLSFPRQEVVRIPLEQYDGRSAFSVSDSQEDSCFVVAKDGSGNGLMELVSLSAYRENITPATASTAYGADGELYYILANAFLTVWISTKGQITSITDTGLGRQILLPDSKAGFVIFQGKCALKVETFQKNVINVVKIGVLDQPISFDAWDVDIFHLDTKESILASSIEVTEAKGLRASLVVQYEFGKSKILSTISLDAVPGSLKEDAMTMLRFDVIADWHERHRFLKFELPLDINADQATYEIAFGTLNRPTHKNTTWDQAKFEVCGHRFADLSEYGYGVALINDCKYGYSCEGSYLRLSLLRSATYPDPQQDQGHHRFSFAVLPHRTHFIESQVPQAALAFNNPLHLRFMENGSMMKSSSILNQAFRLDGRGSKNVFLETVKRGDDDTFGFHSHHQSKSIVLRLYEAFGGSNTLELITKLPVKEVFLVDILERWIEGLKLIEAGDEGQRVELKFKGFEVKTLKFILMDEE